MPNTTTNQILEAYEDHCLDLPGFEDTWSAFSELCELAEQLIVTCKTKGDADVWAD